MILSIPLSIITALFFSSQETLYPKDSATNLTGTRVLPSSINGLVSEVTYFPSTQILKSSSAIDVFGTIANTIIKANNIIKLFLFITASILYLFFSLIYITIQGYKILHRNKKIFKFSNIFLIRLHSERVKINLCFIINYLSEGDILFYIHYNYRYPNPFLLYKKIVLYITFDLPFLSLLHQQGKL